MAAGAFLFLLVLRLLILLGHQLAFTLQHPLAQFLGINVRLAHHKPIDLGYVWEKITRSRA